MSRVDLSNPVVLKNMITSKIKEGNGKFIERDRAVIFKEDNGNEWLLNEELTEEYDAKNKAKAEAEKAKKEAEAKAKEEAKAEAERAKKTAKK